MSRAGRPIRVDQLARDLPNRIALVAGGLGYEGEALQVVKDLHEVIESGDYAISFRGEAALPHRTQPAAASFVGKLIATKYATACKVCGATLGAGSDVLWSKGVGCACISCGEAA